MQAKSASCPNHRTLIRKLRTSALCVPYSQTKTQLVLILLDLTLDTEGSVACSSVTKGCTQSKLVH